MKVGIIGVGAIGLGCAAWVARAGHSVAVFGPRGKEFMALNDVPLESSGALSFAVRVEVLTSYAELAGFSDVVIVAVPVNGHPSIAEQLVPHLRTGQVVFVSSTASLSALYFYELARAQDKDITVIASGTTVLTARRLEPNRVQIMTRRSIIGLSCLPAAAKPRVFEICNELFGGEFSEDQDVLASSLANINPVAHPPLVLFNWTRIERPESWPQYHFMTPRVSSVIEQLDAERRAAGAAFGIELRPIAQHFQRSFNARADRLAEIAEELHEKRGGPPGPTDTRTRFLAEDVPFGLVFIQAISRIAGLKSPATQSTIQMSSLISGENFEEANDLIEALNLPSETVEGLLSRIR